MNISRPGFCWEYAELASVLSERCQGKQVYYLPCHGNWGDGLIREGTLAFFRMMGLGYTELHRRVLRRPGGFVLGGKQQDRVLVYGGGGGWSHRFPESARLVSDLKPFFSRVIVLPSSYEMQTPYEEDIIWFARDRYQSMDTNPRARFCHDMAFCLSPQSLGSGSGEGWFLRTDAERSGRWAIPPNNKDLSLQGNYKKPSREFFSAIDHFATIHTDRLHVAIAAALLQKRVNLYSGAYFKNEAVWKSSMDGFYPKVTFVPDYDA